MRSNTHILLGILAGSVYFHYFPNHNIVLQILFSLALIFGVLLPDIDEAHSTIGQRAGFVSKLIQKIFKHRGFFHSAWMILILYALFQFVVSKYLAINNFVLMGFLVGYAAHLLGDAITVNGIKPFYPLGLTICGPVRTGKFSEVLVALAIITWIVTH
ncbi:MAG: metal-dependent hydrolase [DPANN group archaeon]|nr:metal-dependent hydrolase [DPANN group archaeon]